MGEWPDHDAIVRQAIGRYRASVEKAPQVDSSLPDEMARTIAGLVAENEQGEVLFRGEARSHASVSSSLFRALELPSDGDNFDRLVAHDRQTVGRTDESHGATMQVDAGMGRVARTARSARRGAGSSVTFGAQGPPHIVTRDDEGQCASYRSAGS